jgi:predicted phage terminase large subunit-like protein
MKQSARDKLASLTGYKIPCGIDLPHFMHPKQAAFLTWASTRESLYGGAAGGGKSDALLMSALQYVCVPGYSALLLRQTYPQLAGPDGFIDRCNAWLANTDAVYVGTNKRWTFPSGATLSFDHCERDDDRYKFQSFAYHFVGVDELTQWKTDRVYRYVGFSRVRKPSSSDSLPRCQSCGMSAADVPLRTRAATNPGGPGNNWVYERFILNRGQERKFMPAKISDNPSLDAETYVKSLDELDAIERARLLDGNWEVREEGGMFKRDWFNITGVFPEDMQKVRYWDLAATAPRQGTDPDWTVGALVGFKDGRYFVLDIRRMRGTPYEVEKLIRATSEEDGISTKIVMEQEPGSSGVNVIDHYARTVLPGFNFKGQKSSTSKKDRAGVFSAACESGNVMIARGPWNSSFIDECEVFPYGAHDDQVDAISGAIQSLVAKKKNPVRIIL